MGSGPEDWQGGLRTVKIDQARVGQQVRLRTTTGGEIKGRVTDVDADRNLIRIDQGWYKGEYIKSLDLIGAGR